MGEKVSKMEDTRVFAKAKEGRAALVDIDKCSLGLEKRKWTTWSHFPRGNLCLGVSYCGGWGIRLILLSPVMAVIYKRRAQTQTVPTTYLSSFDTIACTTHGARLSSLFCSEDRVTRSPPVLEQITRQLSWRLNQGSQPVHYRLRAIRGGPLGLVNFTPHFIVIQIFQILFLSPVSFYTHPNISDIFVGDEINLFNLTFHDIANY